MEGTTVAFEVGCNGTVSCRVAVWENEGIGNFSGAISACLLLLLKDLKIFDPVNALYFSFIVLFVYLG